MKAYKPKMGRRTRRLGELLHNTNLRTVDPSELTTPIKVKCKGVDKKQLVKQGYKLVMLPSLGRS